MLTYLGLSRFEFFAVLGFARYCSDNGVDADLARDDTGVDADLARADVEVDADLARADVGLMLTWLGLMLEFMLI